MSVYHLRPWEVPPIEAGIACCLLRPQRRRPCRHAEVGEDLIVHDRARRIGTARCVLRGAALIDAEGVRSVVPLDWDRTDPRACADAAVWSRGAIFGAAWLLGQPDWRCLAFTLRFVAQLGEPPWFLELIGWNHDAFATPFSAAPFKVDRAA